MKEESLRDREKIALLGFPSSCVRPSPYLSALRVCKQQMSTKVGNRRSEKNRKS